MARQRSSLSLDDVISIRTLIGIGIRTKTIAEQFHTSKQNIQRIKSAKPGEDMPLKQLSLSDEQHQWVNGWLELWGHGFIRVDSSDV